MVWNRLVRRRPMRRRPMSARTKFAIAKSIIPRVGRAYRYITNRYSKSTIPSRTRVSTRRYIQTKNVERVLKNFSGSKYQGYNADCVRPSPKPSGTQPISYHFFNTGAPLTNMPEFNSMNLFNFPQGDGNTQRVGDYMFIRHSKIKMEVQALPQIYIAGGVQALQSVLQFRLMVVKSNQKYNPCFSQETRAGDSLFLNTQNEEFGYGISGVTSTATTFLNFAQPINKRKWLVYRDQRFKLSPPAQESVASGATAAINTATPKYNTKKYIEFTLPVSKKTHFTQYEEGDPAVTYDVPDNLDTQWLIILQCTNGSYCNAGTERPENYAVNMLGTTSAYDN